MLRYATHIIITFLTQARPCNYTELAKRQDNWTLSVILGFTNIMFCILISNWPKTNVNKLKWLKRALSRMSSTVKFLRTFSVPEKGELLFIVVDFLILTLVRPKKLNMAQEKFMEIYEAEVAGREQCDGGRLLQGNAQSTKKLLEFAKASGEPF